MQMAKSIRYGNLPVLMVPGVFLSHSLAHSLTHRQRDGEKNLSSILYFLIIEIEGKD